MQKIRPGVMLDAYGNGLIVPKSVLLHDDIEPTPEAVRLFTCCLADAMVEGRRRSVLAAGEHGGNELDRRLRRLAVEVLDDAAAAAQNRIQDGETRH